MRLRDIAGPPETGTISEVLEEGGRLDPEADLEEVLNWLDRLGRAAQRLTVTQRRHLKRRVADRLEAHPAFAGRMKLNEIASRLVNAGRKGELRRRSSREEGDG